MNSPILKGIFFNGVLAIGLFLGIAGTLLFLIAFGFLFDGQRWINAGFSGTIIGAILGGGIAIVGQLFVLIESRAKFLEEKKDIQTRLLFTLLQSISDIGSSLKGLKAHLDEGKAHAKKNRVPTALSTIPLATKLTRKEIEKEEKINLLSLGLTDFYNRICVLDARHNAHVDTFERFEADRERLLSIVALISKNGEISLQFSESNEVEAQGRIRMMNSNLDKMRNFVSMDVKEIDELLPILLAEISALTGKKMKFTPNKPSTERIDPR